MIPPDREGSGRWRPPHRVPQRDQEGGFTGRADGQSHLFQRRHQTGHRRPESGETSTSHHTKRLTVTAFNLHRKERDTNT